MYPLLLNERKCQTGPIPELTPAVKVVPENATSEEAAPTVTNKACLVHGGIVFEDHSTVVSDLMYAMAEESFRAHLTSFVSKW